MNEQEGGLAWENAPPKNYNNTGNYYFPTGIHFPGEYHTFATLALNFIHDSLHFFLQLFRPHS